MIEQSKPPSTVVDTVKATRNLLRHASDVTIIGCFTGEDDPALEVFQNTGQLMIILIKTLQHPGCNCQHVPLKCSIGYSFNIVKW